MKLTAFEWYRMDKFGGLASHMNRVVDGSVKSWRDTGLI